MTGIPVMLDEQAHRLGFQRWVGLDYDISPHVLTSGRTGSGKTVLAKLILARTILLAQTELQPVTLTVIDPKADTDFNFLNGLSRFHRGENAPKGLEQFYQSFRKRQSGEDKSRNLQICFVDEFASLLNFIEDKKEKEAIQRKLSLLLMLARSFRCSIQLATQQPNAQTMGNSGNREQFGMICLLGDSGAETQQMLFDGESRERMKQYGHVGGRGVGWASFNGGLALPVRVPRINDMGKLNNVIKQNLENNKEE